MSDFHVLRALAREVRAAGPMIEERKQAIGHGAHDGWRIGPDRSVPFTPGMTQHWWCSCGTQLDTPDWPGDL
jgi:hypothetical protein